MHTMRTKRPERAMCDRKTVFRPVRVKKEHLRNMEMPDDSSQQTGISINGMFQLFIYFKQFQAGVAVYAGIPSRASLIASRMYGLPASIPDSVWSAFAKPVNNITSRTDKKAI